MKINKTIDFQETRKYPTLLHKIIADDRMKQRWKLSTERANLPYEAEDTLELRYRALDYVLARRANHWHKDPKPKQTYKNKLDCRRFIGMPFRKDFAEISPVEEEKSATDTDLTTN